MNEEKEAQSTIGQEIEQEMPAVTLRGLTIFPDMIIHFDLSRPKSVLAIEEAMLGSQRLFVVTQLDPSESEPDFDNLYTVGTIVKIRLAFTRI